jgi:hypothetical protein
VRIIGGLGNQMFQYAIGRAMSLEWRVPLLLDTHDFIVHPAHQGFELSNVFSIVADVAHQDAVINFLGWQSSLTVRRVLARPVMKILRSEHYIVEPHFHYWPAIHNTPSSIYLDGYWQSWRYFADIESTIRDEFVFRQPLVGPNFELATRIGEKNAVSLHIRRGDYAQNAKTLATHGLCPLEYYEEAIANIDRAVDDPLFFIFSDDMAWVQANLAIKHPHQFVTHNRGAESYNDMRLMSLCKHHIIANSSFSWWGAWLNPDPEKIVIAPRRWFAKDINTDDLIPESWVRL